MYERPYIPSPGQPCPRLENQSHWYAILNEQQLIDLLNQILMHREMEDYIADMVHLLLALASFHADCLRRPVPRFNCCYRHYSPAVWSLRALSIQRNSFGIILFFELVSRPAL